MRKNDLTWKPENLETNRLSLCPLLSFSSSFFIKTHKLVKYVLDKSEHVDKAVSFLEKQASLDSYINSNYV